MTYSLEEKQSEIDKNFDAFEKMLPELMKSQVGRYAVMRKQEAVAFFDTTRDAMVHGSKMYDDGLFSIQEVTQKPVDLGWLSDAPLHIAV